MEEVIFNFKDLIIILGILVPIAGTFAVFKYRQNVIEKRIEKQEMRFDKFKDTIYEKINDLVETTHKIELNVKGVEACVHKAVLQSIGELIKKMK